METHNFPINTDNSPSTQSVQPLSHSLLPRSAWYSQLTKLRLTLYVKQLLDQQENAVADLELDDMPK